MLYHKHSFLFFFPPPVQDMISALKGALSGSLETVILGLMKSTAQYDAFEIKASIKVTASCLIQSAG